MIPYESLINKIYHIREQKVMLDSDLAELYGVERRGLNKASKIRQHTNSQNIELVFQYLDELVEKKRKA
jgi:hypothetical protein